MISARHARAGRKIGPHAGFQPGQQDARRAQQRGQGGEDVFGGEDCAAADCVEGHVTIDQRDQTGMQGAGEELGGSGSWGAAIGGEEGGGRGQGDDRQSGLEQGLDHDLIEGAGILPDFGKAQPLGRGAHALAGVVLAGGDVAE